MVARAMAQIKLPWHHVTILLTIIPLTFAAGSKNIDSGCKCTMYDYDYMFCDCCPSQPGPGYIFRMDYSYRRWSGATPDSGTCDDGRTSQGCDCVFCGYIMDTFNPFYATCTDMPFTDRDFMELRTYELNITYSNGPTHTGSYNHFVKADNSIMLPSPPTFEECSSHLEADQNVVVNVVWKPKRVHEIHRTDLIYTVKWHVLGDKKNQGVSSTKDKNLTLTGLLPNTLYSISLTCRNPSSPYESAPVQKIIVTAERKPQKSPNLLNYLVNSNGCDSQGLCNITVFFQPLALEHQSANCTGYSIEVKGPRVQFNQSANCSDVVVVIGEPLSRNSSYDVTLRYLSKVGPSPPGHLRVPALQDEGKLEAPVVIIERNQSHVALDIKWEAKVRQTAPPTHYGLFYCRGTATDKCLESVIQDTLTADDNGSATLLISNPGYDFLFNVALYRANVTLGLQEQWLCVFDSCGDLLPPEFGLAEVQEEGALSLTLKEAGCTPVQRGRGRPHLYHVELINESAQVEQKHTVEVFGPVRIRLKGLTAAHFYKVKVRSQSMCTCSHHRPLCQYSLWTEQRIRTQEKAKEVFPAWVIVTMSALSVILAAVLAGWSYCFRRTKELRRSLEHDKLVSVISANQYEKTRTWLEQNNFLVTPENGELVSSNLIMSADSDSGIQDSDDGGQQYFICQCTKKRKKVYPPSTDAKTPEDLTSDVHIMGIRLLSSSSHDSGQSGNNSVPESPSIAEDVMLKETCPLMIRNEVSGTASVDGNQPESGITLYTCQVSPVSSMNEPLANHTEKEEHEGQLDNSNRAKVTAKADQSSDEHQFEEGTMNPKPFIPHGVYVPGINSLSYTDSSSEEELSDPGSTKYKSGPDYAQVRDHEESGPPCSSLGGTCQDETSDCSTENHDGDSLVEVTPVVPNLSVLLKFGIPSLDNDDIAVGSPWNIEKNALGQNPAVVTPDMQPDPSPNDASPSDEIQRDIADVTDKSSNSVDAVQLDTADLVDTNSKTVGSVPLADLADENISSNDKGDTNEQRDEGISNIPSNDFNNSGSSLEDCDDEMYDDDDDDMGDEDDASLPKPVVKLPKL